MARIEASKQEGMFIQHAWNTGAYEVTLERDKKVFVAGYCRETSTLYQCHGCFYHSCPYCYESCALQHT